MDGFELTKISGAVLAALLLIFAPKTLSSIGAGDHGPTHGAALSGYVLPKPAAKADVKAAVAGGAPAAVSTFDPAIVVKLLANAKPEAGEGIYSRCIACHAKEKAAKSGIGPNLWGLIGRAKAGRADFAGYSDAIKAKGGDWTFADLASFLHNSKEWMPGTKMNINIAEASDLADLLAYLRTQSDSPVALP